MSVDQADVVDFISVAPAGNVVLTIADHLEWDENSDEHLEMLKEKINRYLWFIDSGELLKKYPKAKDRDVVISVFGKFPLKTPSMLGSCVGTPSTILLLGAMRGPSMSLA